MSPFIVLNRKNSFPTGALGNWLKSMKAPVCVLGTEVQTLHQGGRGNSWTQEAACCGGAVLGGFGALPILASCLQFSDFSSLLSKMGGTWDHCGIRTIHVKCLNYMRKLGFFSSYYADVYLTKNYPFSLLSTILSTVRFYTVWPGVRLCLTFV